ncbi:hypothetical protein, partial [Duodenibacillus massiliensis]|uniref:hypothetical protein n=1 Tax=Duodenibacillus massiliensis TaxID=1852381 RepID=UPI00307A98BC
FPHEESAKKLIYLALQRIYNLMRRNCDFSGSGAPLHSRPHGGGLTAPKYLGLNTPVSEPTSSTVNPR